MSKNKPGRSSSKPAQPEPDLFQQLEDAEESAHASASQPAPALESPAEAVEESKPLAPAPKPAPAEPTEEEFRAIYADEEPAPTKPSARTAGSATLVDRIGLIAAGIIFLGLLVGIAVLLSSNSPQSTKKEIRSTPAFPVSGQFVKIEKASSGWRQRTDADKVPLQLDPLTSEKVYARILPQLTLDLKPGSDGFVRVIFFNSENEPIGDTRIIGFTAGTIQPNEGIVINGNQVAITASRGIIEEAHLADYLASDLKRWHVQISESSDARVTDEEWKLLDEFSIANEEL